MHMIFLAVVLALLGATDVQALGRHPRDHAIQPTTPPRPVANQPRDDAPAAPVPEPATLLLLGAGAAGLYAWRKRRDK